MKIKKIEGPLNNESQFNNRVTKDKLGICFSGACVAHCLLMPLLVVISGSNILVQVLTEEWVHALLLLPVFAMLTLSLPPVWRKTRNPWLLALSISGVVLLLMSRVTHDFSEAVLTVAGSVLVIAAHQLSIKLRRLHADQQPISY